jgi:hypothetical protein
MMSGHVSKQPRNFKQRGVQIHVDRLGFKSLIVTDGRHFAHFTLQFSNQTNFQQSRWRTWCCQDRRQLLGRLISWVDRFSTPYVGAQVREWTPAGIPRSIVQANTGLVVQDLARLSTHVEPRYDDFDRLYARTAFWSSFHSFSHYDPAESQTAGSRTSFIFDPPPLDDDLDLLPLDDDDSDPPMRCDLEGLQLTVFANPDEPHQCSICLEDVQSGEPTYDLDCKHVFHQDCLSPWLMVSGCCPLCRRTVVSLVDASDVAVDRGRVTSPYHLDFDGDDVPTLTFRNLIWDID